MLRHVHQRRDVLDLPVRERHAQPLGLDKLQGMPAARANRKMNVRTRPRAPKSTGLDRRAPKSTDFVSRATRSTGGCVLLHHSNWYFLHGDLKPLFRVGIGEAQQEPQVNTVALPKPWINPQDICDSEPSSRVARDCTFV